MKKRTLSLALALVMCLGLAVPALAVYETPTFTDVPKSHWAYTFVEQAAEKGWVTGVGDGKFMPDGQVTYAQLVTMLGQAFFKSDVDSYTGVTNPWYAKFCNVANQNGLFNGTNAQNHVLDEQYVGVAVNRYEMAQMLYNVMKAKGLNVTADQNAAKASTADWNSIPYKYRDAVAVCKAAGVINGTDSNGTFGGNGLMTRAQACVVLIQLDKYIANGGSSGNQGGNQGGQGNQPQDPNANYGPVGTMSDFKVTLSLDTHKPIHDYWSQQSAEIRSLTDKDNFNAAVQSMRDAEMILTEGEFGKTYLDRTTNLYYNYATANPSADGAEIISNTIGDIRGYAYGNYAYMPGKRANSIYYTIGKASDADQLAEVFAPIFAKFPSNASDKQKVEICVQEIVNRFDYETGVAGAIFSWTNGKTKGNCESYANAASQILAAAGIPNMQMKGVITGGAHAWNLVYVDGEWMIVDGTSAEAGYTQPESISSYEQRRGVSHSVHSTDEVKVAMALVEASLS